MRLNRLPHASSGSEDAPHARQGGVRRAAVSLVPRSGQSRSVAPRWRRWLPGRRLLLRHVAACGRSWAPTRRETAWILRSVEAGEIEAALMTLTGDGEARRSSPLGEGRGRRRSSTFAPLPRPSTPPCRRSQGRRASVSAGLAIPAASRLTRVPGPPRRTGRSGPAPARRRPRRRQRAAHRRERAG